MMIGTRLHRTKVGTILLAVIITLTVSFSFPFGSLEPAQADTSVTGGDVISEAGEYIVDDRKEGSIVIEDGVGYVKLIGQGTDYDDNEMLPIKNVEIICEGMTELYIEDLGITSDYRDQNSLIDFQQGGRLCFAGKNILDFFGKGAGMNSTIHVPPDTELELSAEDPDNDQLYLYKYSGGTAIGGISGEANGSIILWPGNYFIKGSKQGATIGSGVRAREEGSPIRIQGANLWIMQNGMGSAFGAGSGGSNSAPVYISDNAIVNINCDYTGYVSSGPIRYGNGSLRIYLDLNAVENKSTWGVDAFGSILKSSGTGIVPEGIIDENSEEPVAVMPVNLNWELYGHDSDREYTVIVDGELVYTGPGHLRKYMPENHPKGSYPITGTDQNWLLYSDTFVYPYVTKEDHEVEIYNSETGESKTYYMVWDEDADMFRRQQAVTVTVESNSDGVKTGALPTVTSTNPINDTLFSSIDSNTERDVADKKTSYTAIVSYANDSQRSDGTSSGYITTDDRANDVQQGSLSWQPEPGYYLDSAVLEYATPAHWDSNWSDTYTFRENRLVVDETNDPQTIELDVTSLGGGGEISSNGVDITSDAYTVDTWRLVDQEMTIKATYKKLKYPVTYDWGTETPSDVTLPTDDTTYEFETNKKEIAIDTTYKAGTTIKGEKNGKKGTWTFSGWTVSDGLKTSGTEEVVAATKNGVKITGSWTFAEPAEITYIGTGDEDIKITEEDVEKVGQEDTKVMKTREGEREVTAIFASVADLLEEASVDAGEYCQLILTTGDGKSLTSNIADLDQVFIYKDGESLRSAIDGDDTPDGMAWLSGLTTISVAEHNYDDGKITQAATCETPGVKTYTCTSKDSHKQECGETKTETVDALGHNLTKIGKKDATCEEDGNVEYYTCSVCNKLFSDAAGTTEITQPDTVVAALGHDWDEGKVTKEATTSEAGVKTYTCKNDSSHTKTEAIPKLTEDAKTDNGSNQGSNSTAKDQASKKIKVGKAKIGTVGSYKNKSLKVKIKKKAKNATIYRYSIRKANAKKWTNKWSKKKTYTFKKLKDKELYQLKAAGYRGKKGIKGADSKISYRYMSAVLKKAKGGKGKVTAIWKKDSKASGYEIRYATSKKAAAKAKIIKIGKGKTTKVIKGLAKGKTYYVQVRPYKNYKGHKYNGIWWTKKAKVQ